MMSSMLKYALVSFLLCLHRVGALQKDNLAQDKFQEPPAAAIERKGARRIGDPCVNSDDCHINVPGAICDVVSQMCQCSPEFPVATAPQTCSKALELNESCTVSAQCRHVDKHRECRNERCQCDLKFKPTSYPDGHIWCIEQEIEEWHAGSYVDPTMIGVLVGLALMFIIMCVVLRLFSKARWRENRTIFNTPNPRLMNATLLKEGNNKSSGSRRGSLRSRQPSLTSLPRSPNGSSAGSGLRRWGSQRSLQEDAATSTDHNHVAVEVNSTVSKV